MNIGPEASPAARQIEHWYQEILESMVQAARVTVGTTPGRLSPVNGPVLALAHEQTWRHSVVRAQHATTAEDWALLTVDEEAATYQHLLSRTAAMFRVDEDEILAAQSTQGYRHHPR